MQTFQGLAVSDGLTVGPVVRIDRGAAGLHRIVCDPFRERALYEAAIVLAKDELNRLQQHACGQDADILMFQIALLEDESFTNEIGDYIAAGAGSAAAVERAEQIFSYRDYPYMKKRWEKFCRHSAIAGTETLKWEKEMECFHHFLGDMWEAVCRDEVFFGDWMPELARFLG